MATLSQLINAKAIAIAKLAVRATTAAGIGLRATLSWNSNTSSIEPSNRSAHRCAPGHRVDQLASDA
jgi:hypothetical protein